MNDRNRFKFVTGERVFVRFAQQFGMVFKTSLSKGRKQYAVKYLGPKGGGQGYNIPEEDLESPNEINRLLYGQT